MCHLTLISLAFLSGVSLSSGPSGVPRVSPPAGGPVELVDVPSMLIKIDEQVDVPAREAGMLASVQVHEGQMVEQGDCIAQIEDDEARIAAEQGKNRDGHCQGQRRE